MNNFFQQRTGNASPAYSQRTATLKMKRGLDCSSGSEDNNDEISRKKGPKQWTVKTSNSSTDSRNSMPGPSAGNTTSSSRPMLSSPEFQTMGWQMPQMPQMPQMQTRSPVAPQSRFPAARNFESAPMYGSGPMYGTVPMQPHSYGALPAQQPAYGVLPAQQPSTSYGMTAPPRFKPIFMRNGTEWLAEDPFLQAEFAKTPPSMPTPVTSTPVPVPMKASTPPVASKQTSKTSVLLTPKKEPEKKEPPTPPKRESLRVMSGTVDKIIKWASLTPNYKLLFEVIGPLISVRQGATIFEKVLLLREQVGPALQVVFYEIDRPLPPIYAGQHVRCVGKMISRNKMQAFCVSLATEAERTAMQRLAFICQRVFQELNSASKESTKDKVNK